MGRPAHTLTERHRHGAARWPLAVVAIAALLLVSYGGGVIAAPLTLPLLYLALRQPLSRGIRPAIVAVSALTAAEAGWAAAYLTTGEARPWVWLVPCAAGIGVLVVYSTTRPSSSLGEA
jgi:hypothetical protein